MADMAEMDRRLGKAVRIVFKFMAILAVFSSVGGVLLPLLGINIEPLSAVRGLTGDHYFLLGFGIACGTSAIYLCWFSIWFAWTCWRRRKAKQQENFAKVMKRQKVAEQKWLEATEEDEAEERKEAQRETQRAIEAFEAIRREAVPQDEIVDPTLPALVASEANVGRFVIRELGLAHSEQRIERLGGWATYAAESIPFLQEIGVDEMREAIAQANAIEKAGLLEDMPLDDELVIRILEHAKNSAAKNEIELPSLDDTHAGRLEEHVKYCEARGWLTTATQSATHGSETHISGLTHEGDWELRRRKYESGLA